MTRLTIALGAALVALGVGAYFALGRPSYSTLLPAVFGVALLALGLLARRERWRRHAIHAALAGSLLAVLAMSPRLVELPALLTGTEMERPRAIVLASITAAALLLYLALGVRSFLTARRARPAEG
jgi:hypothetical protein